MSGSAGVQTRHRNANRSRSRASRADSEVVISKSARKHARRSAKTANLEKQVADLTQQLAASSSPTIPAAATVLPVPPAAAPTTAALPSAPPAAARSSPATPAPPKPRTPTARKSTGKSVAGTPKAKTKPPAVATDPVELSPPSSSNSDSEDAIAEVARMLDAATVGSSAPPAPALPVFEAGAALPAPPSQQSTQAAQVLAHLATLLGVQPPVPAPASTSRALPAASFPSVVPPTVLLPGGVGLPVAPVAGPSPALAGGGTGADSDPLFTIFGVPVQDRLSNLRTPGVTPPTQFRATLDSPQSATMGNLHREFRLLVFVLWYLDRGLLSVVHEMIYRRLLALEGKFADTMSVQVMDELLLPFLTEAPNPHQLHALLARVRSQALLRHKLSEPPVPKGSPSTSKPKSDKASKAASTSRA